ncbi:MAG: hypothetical protein LBE76_06665 [Nitrososphaerota archaeon]|jgi:uncharacterized membrane protein YiaA|nr:hypothetical protein [Nitrososphaerota archaeon]
MTAQTKRSLKFKVGLFIPLIAVIILFTAISIAAPLIQTEPLQKVNDFDLFYSFHKVFSVINIALLIVLLCVYINIYRKIRSEFAFGLITFGFVFLLKDIVANPFIANTFGYASVMSGLGPFILLPDLFEFAVILILLYINIQY